MAASEQVVLYESEKPLDLVEPTGIRWGEMHLEPGVSGQPSLHSGRLVGSIVVADQVHGQAGRDFRVDLGEELAELDGAVPAMQAGDDGAVTGVEGREQAGLAIP
jgi:hypothetical protein